MGSLLKLSTEHQLVNGKIKAREMGAEENFGIFFKQANCPWRLNPTLD